MPSLSMQQPSKCRAMKGNSSQWSNSGTKLTRPQKRRRRLELRAAAEALKSKGSAAETSDFKHIRGTWHQKVGHKNVAGIPIRYMAAGVGVGDGDGFRKCVPQLRPA